MTNTKIKQWVRNIFIVLIICGIIGIALAVVLFNKQGNRTYSVSTLQFSFKGAEKGLAPNGYPFDMAGLMTDEVLENALAASGLTGTYTADQLRENLVIAGIYPEKISDQLTRYVSLLNSGADANQAAVTDFHATQYNVILYNDFDKNISSEKLTELSNNILYTFRDYFAKTYAMTMQPAEDFATMYTYDYAQQLDIISQSTNQKKDYADQMQTLAPDFLLEKKSFGDISIRYSNLDIDIDRLTAAVILNSVSKDQNRLRQRYEMEIRDENMSLKSLEDELALVEAQLKDYDKDGIIYVSANGALSRVGYNDSDIYDKLVAQRKKLTDEIAELNATISMYQLRLDDMDRINGISASVDDIETDVSAVHVMSDEERQTLESNVVNQLTALLTKQNALGEEFGKMLKAYSDQEINENTISVTAVRYKSPKLVSGAFAKLVIKAAGPLCVLGFILSMTMMLVSIRKEEKAQQGMQQGKEIV